MFPFTDPVMEARWPDGPMAHADSVHVCSTPAVLDLDPTDGLDDPVVIFPSYATLSGEERGVLRMWNPRTHETISYPQMDGELGPFEATGNVAAGDIDGDGRSEVVAMGIYSGTYAVRHDGTLLWESPFPTARDRGLRWARTIGTAITLADLEGDGTVEVIAGRNVLEGIDGTRRFVGDADTTTRGTNQFLGPIACVADLDGDGIQEVIAGRTAFRANGAVFWNQTSLQDGLCAVADMIPTSPGPEVILASVGYLYILDGADGDILYTRVIEGRGRDGVGGAPTVADFDGDGRPEIGIAHGSAYGVYDLDCTARGRPAGCAAAGLLWSVPTGDDSSSGTGSSVFDFNGDGRAEVVYNDQYFFRVYDGATGRALFEHANSSRTRTENPVIVDADNDGDAGDRLQRERRGLLHPRLLDRSRRGDLGRPARPLGRRAAHLEPARLPHHERGRGRHHHLAGAGVVDGAQRVSPEHPRGRRRAGRARTSGAAAGPTSASATGGCASPSTCRTGASSASAPASWSASTAGAPARAESAWATCARPAPSSRRATARW
ncbi:MAG: hypothetical protein M5U28_17460 [Sandaracinaceae bacterium]|nr:hypothetical protein [Sandaracinaceae bacterium]